MGRTMAAPIQLAVRGETCEFAGDGTRASGSAVRHRDPWHRATHMDVAAFAIFEVGPLRSATGGVDAARSVRRVAAREAPAPPPEAGIRAALRVAGVGR
jgi:hypothetical protein